MVYLANHSPISSDQGAPQEDREHGQQYGDQGRPAVPDWSDCAWSKEYAHSGTVPAASVDPYSSSLPLHQGDDGDVPASLYASYIGSKGLTEKLGQSLGRSVIEGMDPKEALASLGVRFKRDHKSPTNAVGTCPRCRGGFIYIYKSEGFVCRECWLAGNGIQGVLDQLHVLQLPRCEVERNDFKWMNRPHCPKYYHRVKFNLGTGVMRITSRVCGQKTCERCGPFIIRDHVAHLWSLVRDITVYEGDFPASQWDKVRKRFNRAGANFKASRMNDRMRVITDTPGVMEGSSEIEDWQDTRLDSIWMIIGFSDPEETISASKAWQPHSGTKKTREDQGGNEDEEEFIPTKGLRLLLESEGISWVVPDDTDLESYLEKLGLVEASVFFEQDKKRKDFIDAHRPQRRASCGL